MNSEVLLKYEVPSWVSSDNNATRINITHLGEVLEFPYKNFPNKIAINDGKVSYTFKQLQELSSLLSKKLTQQGIKAGDRVIVLSEKYCEVVIIMIAIWKSEAIYVPIEPESYSKRADFFESSLEPKLIFGSELHKQKILSDVVFFSFKEIEDLHNFENISYPFVKKSSVNDIAYIIHTSGSTGIPKGVCIEHRKLINYFHNHNEVLRFNEKSYGFSISPFHFDVSIEDTLLPISTGSTVYIYRGLPVASIILNILEKEKITHLIAVSTILTLITSNTKKLDDANLNNLEMVMTGAEVCDSNVINKWLKKLPHARVINAYGPTEVTIVCLTHTIKSSDTVIPIGKALTNNYVHLLDDDGNIIKEINTKGELLIGGDQLMHGYWNNEEETNKVFKIIDEKIYYRSGDICYKNDDNDYVFVGRKDSEHKINGRRINLGEIKHFLLLHPKITNAAVGIINDSKTNEKNIIVVLCFHTEISKVFSEAIINELRQIIPFYLFPNIIGFSNDFIFGKTGKIDEKEMIRQFSEKIISYPESKIFSLNNNNILPIN